MIRAIRKPLTYPPIVAAVARQTQAEARVCVRCHPFHAGECE
jgi:hypothetical protein